jgi:hypothetical protein
MFFLLALSYILSNRFVDGRTIGSKKNKEFLKRKGTIKTIEVIMSTRYFLLSFIFYSKCFYSFFFFEDPGLFMFD